jgi:hypothetical protein
VLENKGWGRGLIGAARKLSIARAEYEATIRQDHELAANLLHLAEIRRQRPAETSRQGRKSAD